MIRLTRQASSGGRSVKNVQENWKNYFKQKEKSFSFFKKPTEPKDGHDKTEEGNLVPDIYTAPNPKEQYQYQVDWNGFNHWLKARRFLNYPSTIYMFRPDVILDPNWRKLPWNRPEKWNGRVLKDKVIYQFRERDDLDAWHTSTDHMFNGFSWSEITQSENGKTIKFRGFLNTKMPTDRLPLPKQRYQAWAHMQTNPLVWGLRELFGTKICLCTLQKKH